VIDVKDLEALLAILDSGSVSRAAEQLGVTQPALSLKLKKMESDLGIHLFQRTSRAMLPLETCRLIEPIARDIVLKLESVKEVLATRMDDLEGVVRIGCLVGWADALLVPVAERVRRLAPRIKLQMQILETSAALDALSNGRLDFAILAKPFEVPDGVESLHLVEEHIVLFSKKLPDCRTTQELRAQLLTMQWVAMSPRDQLTNQYWHGAFGEEFPWSQVAEPIVVDQLFAVRSMVASIPDAVAAMPMQVFQLATELASPFDSNLRLPQRNGLFLAWRGNGLELKRFKVAQEVILECAAAIKEKYHVQLRT
jgi:DNA-binding transcriptional LysR family regulator